jgi:hypothetical protein
VAEVGGPSAQVGWRELDRGWRGLTLETEHVELVLLPDKGCDLYSWADRRTGIDVLFKAPWGLPDRASGGWSDGSQAAWLARYPGGWQVLCPNGGAETEASAGVRWGFHGEACLVSWAIDDFGTDGTTAWAELSTRLYTAPVSMRRRFRLRGRTLTLEESVTNTSPDPLDVMWSHHPAFGAPFLDGGCRIASGARTLVADDEAPGTMLAPGARYDWPIASTADGNPLDLSQAPGPGQNRAHLAYLTDFTDGWFTIINPRLQLGVGVRWPLDVFPHAWFWQEVHSTPGHPWWREAYVAAIEPATTIPAQGLEAARRKGGHPLRLAASESRTTVIDAVLFATATGENENDHDDGDPDHAWPWYSPGQGRTT